MYDTDSPFSGVQRPRPLPVVVLADASGSMGQDDKIQTLNRAIETMVRSLAVEESSTAEVTLAVIAFSHTGAEVHLPPTPVTDVQWSKLGAAGRTPMGEAFGLLAGLLEDEEFLPRDAYLPTLVLVSDGKPTDPWEQPLRQLLDTKAGQALRLAVTIGADADAESQRPHRLRSRPRLPRGARRRGGETVHLLPRGDQDDLNEGAEHPAGQLEHARYRGPAWTRRLT